MENLQKVYEVTYAKRVGGEGKVIVKSNSTENAIKCAIKSVFTGSDFRNAVETEKQYIKPTKQGFQGSQRQ